MPPKVQSAVASAEPSGAWRPQAVSKVVLLAQAKAAFQEDGENDSAFSPRESSVTHSHAVFCTQCPALRVEVDEIKLLLAEMTNAIRQAHEELAAVREQAQVTHTAVSNAAATKPFRDRIQTVVAEVVQSQVLAAEDIVKLRKEHRELAEQMRSRNGDSERIAGEAIAAREASVMVLTKVADVERGGLENKFQVSELSERCLRLEKAHTTMTEALRSIASDVEAVSRHQKKVSLEFA
jgi:hypothetical protein